MTADNYSPSDALTGYYTSRSTNRPARHWAIDKMVHDLGAIGLLDFFEGPGPNPMGLSGASESKLWLECDVGVTSESGTFKRYSGAGSSSSYASWTAVTPGGFLQHLGGLSPVTTSESYATRAAAEAATISSGITYLRTAGFANVFDFGGGLYAKGVSLTTGGFQSVDGAYWDLVPDGQGSVNAKQFGAKFDNTTDDTDAIQDMIDYLEALASDPGGGSPGRGAVGLLPRGSAKITNLTINKGIALIGASEAGTWLRQLVGGSTAAMISVAVSHEGSNYYASGNPPPCVRLQNIRLVGYDRSSGNTSNHGVQVANAGTNPIVTQVQLIAVGIREFAGSGLYGASTNAFVEGYDLDITKCAVANLYMSSLSDWRFHNCDFHGGNTDGIVSTGTSQCQFFGCYVWSNGRHGINLFSSTGICNFVFHGGMIDRNSQHGITAGLANGEKASFSGTTFIYNSAGTDNVYADVHLPGTFDGEVALEACIFGRSYSQAVSALDNVQYHFKFDGTDGQVRVSSCMFMGDAYVTNREAGIWTLADGYYTPTLTNTTNVDSSTAYATHWSRVGTTVTVSGYVTVDATAGSDTVTALGISLPIGSDIAAIEDVGGAGASPGVAGMSVAIFGNAASNRATMQWLSTVTNSQNIMFTFSYRIL